MCGAFNMINNGTCVMCGAFGSLRACVPKTPENSGSKLELLKTIERGANSKVSRIGIPRNIITFPQKYEVDDDELTTDEKQKTFLTAAAREFLRIEVDELEKSMESD